MGRWKDSLWVLPPSRRRGHMSPVIWKTWIILSRFLISTKDVLTAECVGRDTYVTGWMVEMISYVGEQRFIVSLWELLPCHLISFTWQVLRAQSEFKNMLSWGKRTRTYCNRFIPQNRRIYTRESWHWKTWFATVSKLQKAWSSWRHGRYFLLKLRRWWMFV